MTKTLYINAENPPPDALKQARQVLVGGGLVIVPTETVYGIACDPAVPGALESLVSAKGRDEGKPIARLAANTRQVEAEARDWNPGLQVLARTYWPGPLTIVLETATGWTGYRVPDHAVALALAETCGRTLALTSANRSGEPDSSTAQEAAAAVSADLILDGGPSSKQAIPSTVVKVDGNRIECLRAGGLSFMKIEQLFKENIA